MKTRELKDLREKAGMTQVDVARKLGLSITGYVNIEQRVSRPQPEVIKKLQKIFPKSNLAHYLKGKKVL